MDRAAVARHRRATRQCQLARDGLTSLQWRRMKGAITEQNAFTEKNFDVVQLERADNKYIMSVARFGEAFISKEIADVSLGDDVYVGLYVCSHNNTVTERSEEHTSELQSLRHLVCRLLLEKK